MVNLRMGKLRVQANEIDCRLLMMDDSPRVPGAEIVTAPLKSSIIHHP